ncbi:LysR family transcriptional regulator [Pseudomonas kermanshahensis]|uniref:LysR family transcriptional regulator n=1 Tax=Pseudomonas kermanshahensis TaxID=2745482 RepID=UPI0023DBDD2C|nr:LysR family transcriptional regulator [Pseudomonas kermanshahensis]WEL53503.1 LysR family transcriptional regulator [Pseudomonas kermanshahensis]
MSAIEWESQRVFLAVLRSGSLSGAARLLNIAQSTARRRLESLEAALAVSLFTRTSTGLTPTESARRLIHHVESMDIAAQAFNRMASSETDVSCGTIRVTSSDLLGVEVLPRLLRKFHHGHPDLNLQLSINDHMEDLARQESDIAVRLARPTEAGVVVRRTGALRVGLYASAECLAHYGEPASLAALRDAPLVGPDRRSADLRRLVDLGLCEADQRFAVATDNHLAQLAAIRAGLGMGVCPANIAAHYQLKPVLPEHFGFDVDVWIAMHSDLRRIKRISRAFEALGDALHDDLAK